MCYNISEPYEYGGTDMKGKFVNIMFSPTGGTKKVADVLLQRLAEGRAVCDVDLCDRCGDYGKTELTGDDIALIAVPSYGGRVPGTALERLASIKGNGARAVLVCVYGNRAYDNTLAELRAAAETAGFRVVAAVAALAEHSVARQVAAGRPDKEDVSCLQDFAEKIARKLADGDVGGPSVPGEVPDQPAKNLSMAPGFGSNCTQCGVCVEQCPVGAIDAETLKAEKETCIGCMRCIAVCPTHARKLNVVITALGGVALDILCKKRKENELFL